ncbi:Dual specificity protein kinase splB-like [Oopsacas minuta]|uniref:Dual specificity protein kinase splB-like n=1 Tax=Oopsacas minuta TaxID=111878 RepID=A0AAV7K8J3_9METZ|nr:Dual specificity protein kinase splB-like [Oopsacas minuta]
MCCKAVIKLVFALTVFGHLEQFCNAECDARSIQVSEDGLEVCERYKDNKIWLPLCADPTPDKTANVFCRSSSFACEKECNLFNYTVIPRSIYGFIFRCEASDSKAKHCDVTTGHCSFIIDTLNCECNHDCPLGYFSPNFCANNTCSCSPRYEEPTCQDRVKCEIGELRANSKSPDSPVVEICAESSGVNEWFPLCPSNSNFLSVVRPLCRSISSCRADCKKAIFSFLPSNDNTTIGYNVTCNSSASGLSLCDVTPTTCSTNTLSTLECFDNCITECRNGGICGGDGECLCPYPYTGETCDIYTLNTTTSSITITTLINSTQDTGLSNTEATILIFGAFSFVVIACIILSICVILLIVYIKSRPSKLQALEKTIIFTTRERIVTTTSTEDTEEVVYASVKLEDMLVSTSNRSVENRYSSATNRTITNSVEYVNSGTLPAGDQGVRQRGRNYTNQHNVENQLYLSVLPGSTDSSPKPVDINTSTLQHKPFLYSSSIVQSHQQRAEKMKGEIIKQGESYFSSTIAYRDPPGEVEGIYKEMSECKYREINLNCILLQEQLGIGCFGRVLRAEWKMEEDTDPIPVAVKCLNKNADSKLRLSFLTEAAIMGQFNHPNVLRLLGIVSVTEPYMLIIELMEGDLRNILATIASVTFDSDKLLQSLLLSTRDIVNGMEYLSSKHFVHRDLAARNVLVGSDRVCRIGDFGLSKRMHEDKDYYKVERGGVVAVRWTAPEALFFRRYSEKSDVWSLGMTLFEVWSVGQKPWGDYTNVEVIEMVGNKSIQGPPTGCPYQIYSLMVKTWNIEPTERLTFSEIAQFLKQDDRYLLDFPEDLKSGKAGQLGNDPALSASLFPELRQ